MNYIRTRMQQRRVNKMVSGFYADLKQSLSSNSNGLTESDILHRYLAYPKISQAKDGLARDDYSF